MILAGGTKGLGFSRYMILRRDEPYARAVVPDHQQIRTGTLRRIVVDAGLTVDQFIHVASVPHDSAHHDGPCSEYNAARGLTFERMA